MFIALSWSSLYQPMPYWILCWCCLF